MVVQLYLWNNFYKNRMKLCKKSVKIDNICIMCGRHNTIPYVTSCKIHLRGDRHMEYNEREFQSLANKQALSIWVILNSILTVAYIIETTGGKKTINFLIVFLILAWLPVIIGVATLKIKGMHTRWFREIVAVGYGVFFTYVVFTAETAITFCYVFPVAGTMILYKDKWMHSIIQ